MVDNILEYLRIALYIVLASVAFFLFQAWQTDHYKPQVQANETPVTANVSNSSIPNLPVDATTTPAQSVAVNTATTASAAVPASTTGQIIKVTTDLFAVNIDTRGGDIVETKLLKYAEALNSPTPFTLLNNDSKNRYLAESGLLSKQGPDTNQEQALYTSEQTSYQMPADQNELIIPLHWQKDGVTITKYFTFTRGSYETKVSYDIENKSASPWQGNFYTQLLRTDSPPETHSGLMNLTTYFGAAVSSPAKPFEKITFKQMQEKSLQTPIQQGWAAMVQHYFISAWVPDKNATYTYYTRVLPNNLYSIGMISPTLNVAAGNKISVGAKLYTGPAIANQLEKTAPGLKLTIDYGWFWPISGAIFWMMQKIYEVVGNWGWSIVFVTILIKLIFFQLSAKSYRSMSGLKKLQPRIEALKERYGDDKQKLTQATLELYRTEKVNPMSGCLPILIQIPVFIALYWVLVESVEMRQAPFILWIHDLSQHDPYYILPLLMGASMFIQQRLNPPPPDPVQAKVMMLMPVVFTFLFMNFPAGLMLYWFVNNTLSFLQQWYIMRKVNA